MRGISLTLSASAPAIALFLVLSPSVVSSPLTLADATGETVAFSEPPRRIVSLNPDFTESLFALGAGDRVIGVTTFCDYPPEAAGKERVGDLWTPSVEKIFSLSPDLVLTTQEGNRPQTVETLRKLGLRVFVSPPARSLEEYFERLVELGRIVGAETRAGELIAEFRSEIARTRHSAGRASPRIFFQLGSAPIVSAARGTIIHELIEIAGGVNIAADAPLRYPSFSREKVVADDPEIILIAAMGGEGEKCRDEWMAFAGMAAVKTGRIYFIDPDLVCRLSPRLIEGLRTLAGMIQKKVISNQWSEDRDRNVAPTVKK